MDHPKQNPVSHKPTNPDHLNKFVAGITDRCLKAIVLVILDAGLRVEEIVQLDKDSITFIIRVLADGSMRVTAMGRLLCHPSHEVRIFYFGADTVAALTDYLNKDRSVNDSSALFTNQYGRRLAVAELIPMMQRS